jgi:YVTN family beta-propeller protein
MRRTLAVLLAAVSLSLAAATLLPRGATTRTQAAADFMHFESGHVHPLAMTPDGSRLLAVNTADGRLAVFSLTGPAPARIADIPVGLEPVSVAVRSNHEAWVVNQLSDDISIVDLTTLHVRATLRVGDEPADVAFAGTPARAWVSVSQEDAIKLYDPRRCRAPSRYLRCPRASHARCP